MRSITSGWVIITMLLCCSFTGNAQSDWNDPGLSNSISADTTVRKGDTLIFINKEITFSRPLQQRLKNTFFKVYPAEVRMYNPASLKKVIMIIDPAYTGVAATDNGIIRISPKWMQEHPEDIDVVTHEVMHIVQAYPDDAGPGWITEGIADYVRNEFGVNNKSAQWALPEYNARQHYEDAYRVTARFFLWIEKHHTKGLVRLLDNAMRTKTYTSAFWKTTTGKTADELWKLYAENPAL